MRINKIFRLSMWLGLGALTLTGCSQSETSMIEPVADAVPVKLQADVAGGLKAKPSKVVKAGTGDMWSTTWFNYGDLAGFYSAGGNMDVPDGEIAGTGQFVNLPLTFAAGGNSTFDNLSVVMSPRHMSADEIYIYFPYCADQPLAGNPDAYGLELRMTDGVSDTLRCVDYMTIYELESVSLSQGLMLGLFDHVFSELIILRGEGFDTPPAGMEGITVVMKEGYSHIRLNYTANPWSVTPELVYDPSYSMSQDDCKRWTAWVGENYGKTLQDTIGLPAQYVLLPTLGHYDEDSRTAVDHIEIYDNEGNLQLVSSLSLYGGNTKELDSGWRYPIEINMTELGPSVTPYPILPWNEDVDFTDQRERGISQANFEKWTADYATYLANPADYETLYEYGDRVVDTEGNVTWHFYLISDIDLSEISYNPAIARLDDILDGQNNVLVNHTFQNYKITGLSMPFVGTLGSGGSLTNIDFVEPTIINNNVESEPGDDVDPEPEPLPMGILANTVEGGTINNCTIKEGTLISPNPVGLVAGTAQDVTVTNCTFTGFIVGTSTFDSVGSIAYWFADEPQGTNDFSGNTSNIVFTSY